MARGKSAILSVRIISDAKNASKGFKQAESRVGGFMKKMGGMSGMMKAGGLALAGAAAAAGKYVYDVGREFQDLTDTIRTGTGATGEGLKGLVNVAKKVGKTVPAEFSQIAPVVADLNTTLGYSGKNLETVSKQVLELSRITKEDVNIRDMSSTLSGFGIKADEAAAAMDDLFRVSQATGVPINELTSKLKTQGGVLTSVGFKMKDGAALLGVLTKAGVNADTVIKGMGQGLIRVAKDGEKPAVTFRRVIGEIDGMVKAGKDAQALTEAGKVFGTRGATQFVAALKAGKFAFSDLDKVAGTTKDTILGLGKETMHAGEKWQMLKNRADAALEPIASKLVDIVDNGFTRLSDSVDGIDFSKAAAGFEQILPRAAEQQALFNDLASLLKDNLIPLLKDLTPVFKMIYEIGFAQLKGFVSMLTGVISLIRGLIHGDWSMIWEGAKKLITGALTIMTSHISAFINAALRYFTGGKASIHSVVSAIWNGVVNLFSNGISRAKNSISNGFYVITSWFSTLPARIIGALGNLGNLLWNAGSSIISGFTRGLKNAWESTKNFVGGIGTWIKDHKGPLSYDRRLLTPAGKAIMHGLTHGLRSQMPSLRAVVGDMTGTIERINPSLSSPRFNPRAAANTAAQIINITVNGALDPVSVARQIEELLSNSRIRKTATIEVH